MSFVSCALAWSQRQQEEILRFMKNSRNSSWGSLGFSSSDGWEEKRDNFSNKNAIKIVSKHSSVHVARWWNPEAANEILIIFVDSGEVCDFLHFFNERARENL